VWTELLVAKNRFTAELWKELFDAEGVATQIVIDGDPAVAGDLTPRRVFVPDSKTHVAREILRKI
jgi:putative signal transducing protein